MSPTDIPDIPNLLTNINLGSAEKPICMDDLWKIIRKLSNKNVQLVCEAIFSGGKTFSELQTDTGLIVNDLNHVLYDMKNLNLIVIQGEKKGEKTYHLTSFCVVLLNALDNLASALNHIEPKDLFTSA